VSATTRPRREGETDGVDYVFMTPGQFEAAEAAGEFLESAVVHGNRYGTPKTLVEKALAEGRHVILEIDVQGARSVRKARPDAVAVFIEPPSWEVLAARLTGRGTEDPAVVERRLKNAREELAAAPEFDERVMNDRLEDAVDEVDRILEGTP
jgi:guanylate kinase